MLQHLRSQNGKHQPMNGRLDAEICRNCSTILTRIQGQLLPVAVEGHLPLTLNHTILWILLLHLCQRLIGQWDRLTICPEQPEMACGSQTGKFSGAMSTSTLPLGGGSQARDLSAETRKAVPTTAEDDRPRTKEAESVSFDAWPSINAFRQWRMHFRRTIASSATKPTVALAWASAVSYTHLTLPTICSV